MSQRVSSLTTCKKRLKETMIIFLSVVVSILLFMFVAVIVNNLKGPLMANLNKFHIAFTFGMAALSFICLVAGKRLFNKRIAAAKNSLNPLDHKLNQHRSALVVYLAMCEVPVILSIVLFVLTGDFIYQVFACISFGFMLAMTPVKRRLIAELELNEQEQKELE